MYEWMELGVWLGLEVRLVQVRVLVLGVWSRDWAVRHRVRARCRARDVKKKSRSGRAGWIRCRARAGCTAKAKSYGKGRSSERPEYSIPWQSLQFVFSPPGTCPRF